MMEIHGKKYILHYDLLHLYSALTHTYLKQKFHETVLPFYAGCSDIFYLLFFFVFFFKAKLLQTTKLISQAINGSQSEV